MRKKTESTMSKIIKKAKLTRQKSLVGMETRRNAYIGAFSFLVLSVMAFFAVCMIATADVSTAISGLTTAAIFMIPVIKGGNPKNTDELDQEGKDVLATIQKGINEELSKIEIKEATSETIEKAIDEIVEKAMDELKNKDLNGKFAVAMKELAAYGETIKNVAQKLDRMEKGEGFEFGQKSGIEKMVDEVISSDKFKEFVKGNVKRSGKIRFETKAVSITNDYDGDKLITRRSSYVREHPQPRRINMRDIMLVETGDENMPSITFSQITDLDRNAAVTSENGTLAQSAFKVREITEPVKRIGTWVPVSKRMLKSVSWLRSWLINRLPQWIRLAEDFQILKGDGTGDNFLGLAKQCPDFKNVLGTLITGAAGSVASIASYDGGTKTLVTFANPIAELNNGMNITFAAFPVAAYNAKFTVYKKSDREIVIEQPYATSVTTAVTFTAGGEFLSTVEAANIGNVVSAAQAYLTYGEYTPTSIAMNPIDVFKAENLKSTDGKTLDVVKNVGGVKYIGTLPIVETTAVVPDEFIIGDFTNGASLVDFTAVELEFAEDVQTKLTNQVAIIVQEETIMPVYNPFAFLKGKFSEIIPLINA